MSTEYVVGRFMIGHLGRAQPLLTALATQQEETLAIEYTEVMPEPEHKQDLPHDDWVACVAAGGNPYAFNVCRHCVLWVRRAASYDHRWAQVHCVWFLRSAGAPVECGRGVHCGAERPHRPREGSCVDVKAYACPPAFPRPVRLRLIELISSDRSYHTATAESASFVTASQDFSLFHWKVLQQTRTCTRASPILTFLNSCSIVGGHHQQNE